MFKNYTEKDYQKIVGQHNIMILVGNGFDMGITSAVDPSQTVCSYSNFYRFVMDKGMDDKTCCIYPTMKTRKMSGDESWADFERIISSLIDCDDFYDDDVDWIERDIETVQNHFSEFLNQNVTADLLIKIGELSENELLSKQGMSKFLGDLDVEDSKVIEFPHNTNHYHLFNYLFVNFNYTQLLDNYIYLGKKQFVPSKYHTVDTNFEFYPDPCRKSFDSLEINPYRSLTSYSSYLIYDIIHPHGFQDVPRSILFGADKSFEFNQAKRNLIKPYWAQCDRKYSDYFDDCELFVIFGMSLSETDSWWLDKIYDSLRDNQAELIIYYYCKDGRITKGDIKNKFIKACVRHGDDKDRHSVTERIYVVLHSDNNTFLFGTKRK